MKKINDKKKKIRSYVQENYILSALLAVLGIIFLAIPGKIYNALPYLLSIGITFRFLALCIQVYVGSKLHHKIIHGIQAISSLVIVILLIVLRDEPYKLIAILMACYSIEEAIEKTIECIEEYKVDNKRRGFLYLSEVLLEIFFAIELFIGLADSVSEHIIIYGIMYLCKGIVSMFNIRLSQIRKQGEIGSLTKVLKDTYVFEILMGYIVVILGFSLAFPYIEPGMETYSDGLWYTFSIVSTIGFGDLVAQTALGRVLTIVLGIYGIVMFALFTSIIVNYYQTINKKKNEAKEEASIENNKREDDSK